MSEQGQWYCSMDGLEVGPIAWDKVRQFVVAGRLQPDDFVRPAEQAHWLKARDVPNLFAPAAAVAPSAKPRNPVGAAPLPAGKPVAPAPAVAPPVAGPPVANAQPPVGKAVPPAGKPVPPVGKAVGATPAVGKIPSGKAVQPAPGSVPVGKPVGASSFAVNAAPPTVATDKSPNKATPANARGRKPKKNALPMILVGGCIFAAVAITVAAVIVFNNQPKDDAVATEPSTKAAKKVASPASTGEPGNPEASALQTSPVALAAPSGPQTQYKAVRNWIDMSRSQAKLGALSVRVTKAWLAIDQAGTPFVGAAEGPKYLCVEVTIRNGGGAPPLRYTSWTPSASIHGNDGESITAMETTELSPLPRAQRATIGPGSAEIDTLIFPWTKADFQAVKLVLPKSNLGLDHPDPLGFNIPAVALGGHDDGKGPSPQDKPAGNDPLAASAAPKADAAMSTEKGKDVDIVDATDAEIKKLEAKEKERVAKQKLLDAIKEANSKTDEKMDGKMEEKMDDKPADKK